MRSAIVMAFLVLGLLFSSEASAQCPAVGADTDCGIVIVIADTGASLVVTGQGPYDDIEDTLIGVVNKSRLPVTSIDLSSVLPIFGFDGDGIDAYGIPGNSQDSTGYGGPNAYFTNINGAETTGRVNFITPLATSGGTSYFSLEGAISSATACSAVLNNSVPKPPGGGTQISATFTPQSSYTLAQAAQLCGFIEFDWQSTITSWPAPSPLFSACSSTPLVAPPPFNDPPACGYAYQNPPNAVELPVYYNLFTSTGSLSLTANETANQLYFYDAPADPCLAGSQSAQVAAYADSVCGGKGKRAPAGSKLAFTTHLVGIAGALPGASVVDTGIGFSWTDTYNGTSGGIAVSNSSEPVDPGGSGSITVTNYNGTTTYMGVGVTAVNGAPPGKTPELASGDACDGVYSGTFDGNVTVRTGQSCTFVDGTITGNVKLTGGSLVLSGDAVGGNVQVDGGGTFSVSEFTTIYGNVEVHNVSAQQAASQLCSATIYGNGNIHNNDAAVEIGSEDPSCPGNVVVGNLEVHNNSGPTLVDGNTVSGNLHDHNNSGATQVFGNVILQSLQCANNAAITGGTDSAANKEGQCAGF